MGRLRKIRLIGIITFILLVSFWSTLFLYAQENPRHLITKVSFKEQEQRIQVIITTNKPADFKHFKLDESRSIVVDIPDAILSWTEKRSKVLTVSKGAIQQIRVGQYQPNVVRVVIELTQDVPYKAYRLPDSKEILIDISNSSGTVKEAAVQPKPLPSTPPVTSPSTRPSGLITFDAKDADIRDVLRAFAAQQKVNIIADKSVTGKITIHLTDVPFEEALKALLYAHGFTYRKKDNLYFVTKAGEGEVLSVEVTEIPQKVLTIDVRDADIKDVIRNISDQSGIDFIIFGAVREKIDIHLTNVPLEEALKQILSGTKYAYSKVGNTYVIGDPTLTTPTAATLTESKLIKLKYLEAAKALKMLPQSIPSANVKEIKDQNALLITGTNDLIEEAENFIKEVDHPAPQVMIEALIIEFSTDLDLEIGITGEWQRKKWKVGLLPAAGASTVAFDSLGILSKEYWATLEAMITEGTAKIRANPRIATLSGKKATIDVGEVRYYKTTEITTEGLPVTKLHTIEYGIKLDITPWVGGAKEITVDITPTFSQLVGLGAEGLPEIGERTAQTTVRVKDGETIVIGGLIYASKVDTVDKFPVLGHIPGLGYLFRKTKKIDKESEMVIYITPHLLPVTAKAEEEAQRRRGEVEAKRAYREITKKERKEEAKEHYRLGKGFYRKNQYSKALEEFEKAITLNPDHKKVPKKILKMRRKLRKIEEQKLEEKTEEEGEARDLL